MTKFRIEIITPARVAYSEDVDMVSVPTENGTIGVLANHMPLFTSLTDGEIKITKDSKEFFLAIGGGFMQVSHDKVMILVSRAVHADELNEAEIKKAEAAAEDLLNQKLTGVELAQAQEILRRSFVEMKVLRKHQTHRRPDTQIN